MWERCVEGAHDHGADQAALRGEPGVFGRVASDPTVSRLVGVLAGDVDQVLTAIDRARAKARARVWGLAGDRHPTTGPTRTPR